MGGARAATIRRAADHQGGLAGRCVHTITNSVGQLQRSYTVSLHGARARSAHMSRMLHQCTLYPFTRRASCIQARASSSGLGWLTECDRSVSTGAPDAGIARPTTAAHSRVCSLVPAGSAQVSTECPERTQTTRRRRQRALPSADAIAYATPGTSPGMLLRAAGAARGASL